MKVRRATTDGDQEIKTRYICNEVIQGNVTIEAGGYLLLYGRIAKNLIVKPGGMADIYGMVSKDVRNEGGSLSLYGTVVGKVIEEAGTTYISKLAMVAPE